MLRGALLLLLLVVAEPASARNHHAKGGQLRSDHSSGVIIWKNQQGMDDLEKLIAGGYRPTRENMAVIMPMVACVPLNGTKVAVMGADYRYDTKDASFKVSVYDVAVIDGPEAGCRGRVSPQYFVP